MICKHSVDSKKYLLVDSKKCLLSERAAVKPNTTGCVCFYSGEGGGGGSRLVWCVVASEIRISDSLYH